MFSVAAIGTPNLGYQWYFNNVKMGSGSTSTNLVVNNAGTNNAGNYYVVVDNSYGLATSAPVSLTILVPAWIATQPSNTAVVLGQPASFSVAAGGDAPLTYQWRFNGSIIPGATNAQLPFASAQTNQAGSYSVIVSNSYGNVTSSNANLTVYLPTAITSQPQSQGVVIGQGATFSVAATGSTPITYQWYFNGTKLGGSSTGPPTPWGALGRATMEITPSWWPGREVR